MNKDDDENTNWNADGIKVNPGPSCMTDNNAAAEPTQQAETDKGKHKNQCFGAKGLV